jgi:hypothetical protein
MTMTDDERWLFTASDDGCTEALLMAHGFALEFTDGIVSAGLATPKPNARLEQKRSPA